MQADDLDGEIDLRSCTDVTEFAVQRNYGFQIHVSVRHRVYRAAAPRDTGWERVLPPCAKMLRGNSYRSCASMVAQGCFFDTWVTVLWDIRAACLQRKEGGGGGFAGLTEGCAGGSPGTKLNARSV